MLAFVGAKGGVGTTALAANVAASLAAARWSTLFVETAVFHGTAATMLGIGAGNRLDALPLANPETIAPPTVTQAMPKHPRGPRVIFDPSGAS